MNPKTIYICLKSTIKVTSKGRDPMVMIMIEINRG
jgi:hypothetical protein